MEIANRHNELAAFRALISEDTQKRILFISGPSKSGKTILLRRFERICSNEELSNVAEVIKLDGQSIQHPTHLFDEVQQELKVRGNYQFEDFETAQYLGINVSGNKILGTLNLSIIHSEDETKRLRGLSSGFFSDLGKIDKFIILLFDRFNYLNNEFVDWICGILSTVKRSKNIRIVLAGETSLPEDFQWEEICIRIPTLGGINDIEPWLHFTQEIGLILTREEIEAIISEFQGSPRLGDYFRAQAYMGSPEPNISDALETAQTDDERNWIILENLLNRLPETLNLVVRASVVSHWFNQDILKAMLPEVSDQIEDLYEQVKQLYFVQEFPGRGFSIESSVRQQVLINYWDTNLEELRQLSTRMTDYFNNETDSVLMIERLYYLSMTENLEDEYGSYYKILQDCSDMFTSIQLSLLAQELLEQINRNRIIPTIAADIYYWLGDNRVTFNREEALTYLERALVLYEEIDYLEGSAKTLLTIGDTLQSIGQMDDSLERYNLAFQMFEMLKDAEGKAHALKGRGCTSQYYKQYHEALDCYQQALKLYSRSSLSARADIFFKLGTVLQEVGYLERAKKCYRRSFVLYEQKTLYEITTKEDTLGFANVCQRYGTLQGDPIEALKYFGQANTFYGSISDWHNQSRNFIHFMAPCYQSISHKLNEIKTLEAGKKLAEKIGDQGLIQQADRRLKELEC
jgi:tetratricopeptide (TPR) repeat protein